MKQNYQLFDLHKKIRKRAEMNKFNRPGTTFTRDIKMTNGNKK